MREYLDPPKAAPVVSSVVPSVAPRVARREAVSSAVFADEDRPSLQATDARHRFYLPQLDGLRFCAFFLVFLHHSPVFPGGTRAASLIKELGWVGVDLFFVLSAYLLTALLHREHAATGTIDFRRFYIRRLLRIWPLFYCYVALCFLYFLVWGGSDDSTVTGRTIGHIFFLDNFFTALSDQYNPLPFTPHLWTIAFEEQIYVVIPLLFLAIVGLRHNWKLFAITTFAVALSQPLLRLALASFYTKERAVWVLPVFHFDTILAGLLLGAGVGATLKHRVSGDVLSAAGLAALGVVLATMPPGEGSLFLPDRHILVLTSLAFAFFLIVLGCLDGTSRIAWLLSRKPLVFLGRISYGLYVWHLAANHFAPAITSRFLSNVHIDDAYVAWILDVLSALSLTIALSTASYFALERRFLRMKTRFTVVPNRVD